MNSENQVLVIDAGNTSIKIAHFANHKLQKIQRTDINNLEGILEEFSQRKTVISSVLSQEQTNKITSLFKDSFLMNCHSKFPVKLHYKSPETLGIDRICNAVYSAKNMKSKYALCIDIGTCIKFDLTNSNHEYLGGSISPGISLRYKSLNDYTGKLPLLSEKNNLPLVGDDTKSSIQSGVINGINAEIQRLIEQYSSEYKDLTFFVTGGDAQYFDLHAKNGIFADENLTLKGLYEIYKFNE